jgi:hypothetical protein
MNQKGPTEADPSSSTKVEAQMLQSEIRSFGIEGQPLRLETLMSGQKFIFRQCITLRNGKRICKPAGQAFKIPVSDDRDNDDS